MEVALTAAFLYRSNQERDDMAGVGESTSDPVLGGVAALAQFHGVATNPIEPRHAERSCADSFGHTAPLLAVAEQGPKTKVIQQRAERLDRVPPPALTLRDDYRAFVMPHIDGTHGAASRSFLATPRGVLAQGLQRLPPDLSVVRFAGGRAGHVRFSWIVPALVKYRKPILEVSVASFLVRLFELAPPLLFTIRGSASSKLAANLATSDYLWRLSGRCLSSEVFPSNLPPLQMMNRRDHLKRKFYICILGVNGRRPLFGENNERIRCGC